MVAAVVLITVLLSSLYIYWRISRNIRNEKLPPGPAPLPLLGNAHQLYVNPCLKLQQWAKQYGAAFTIKLGSENWVVINHPQLLREIFGDLSSAGRTDNPIFMELMQGPHGVVFSEGKTWKEQRQFALKTLKFFGSSSSMMESLLLEESEILVKWFAKQGNNRIKGNKVFFAPSVNSLWTIICGKRCTWESGQNGMKIVELFYDMLHSIAKCVQNGVLFAPALINLAPEFLGWRNFQRKAKIVRQTLEEVIEEHVHSFNELKLRDYIDAFLHELRTPNESSSFNKQSGHLNMVASLIDLFGAGSETSSLALSWATLYLSKNMEIQAKMFEEIKNVVGDGTPCLNHRNRMPYTESVILETLRIRPIFYISLPHKMLEDKSFGKYLFKKGTVIIGNLFTMLHDESVWTNPEVFNPERFLKDGKLDLKREFVSFSFGKRRCVGEAMAKNTLFLFLVQIVKNFLILPEGVSSVEPNVGGFLEPKEFNVILSRRNDIDK